MNNDYEIHRILLLIHTFLIRPKSLVISKGIRLSTLCLVPECLVRECLVHYAYIHEGLVRNA